MQTLILILVISVPILGLGWSFILKKEKQKQNYFPIATADVTAEEAEFIRLVNEHRINLGLNPLIPEKLACEVCKIRVLKDIANDIWGNHLGWEKMLIDANAKYGGHVYGNNYISAIDLFNAYMASPKHKAALENKDRTHMGTSFIERRNHTILTKYK